MVSSHLGLSVNVKYIIQKENVKIFQNNKKLSKQEHTMQKYKILETKLAKLLRFHF